MEDYDKSEDRWRMSTSVFSIEVGCAVGSGNVDRTSSIRHNNPIVHKIKPPSGITTSLPSTDRTVFTTCFYFEMEVQGTSVEVSTADEGWKKSSGNVWNAGAKGTVRYDKIPEALKFEDKGGVGRGSLGAQSAVLSQAATSARSFRKVRFSRTIETTGLAVHGATRTPWKTVNRISTLDEYRQGNECGISEGADGLEFIHGDSLVETKNCTHNCTDTTNCCTKTWTNNCFQNCTKDCTVQPCKIQ